MEIEGEREKRGRFEERKRERERERKRERQRERGVETAEVLVNLFKVLLQVFLFLCFLFL